MDWTHLHLALNHVPVLGTPFLLGFVLWSWWRGQAVTLRFCLWLFVALAAALFLSRGGRVTPKWSLMLLAFLALATFALMARTANFGGRLRHPEIRPAPEDTP